MDFSGHMTTGAWILSILGIAILVALAVGMIVVLVSAMTRPGSSRGSEHAAGEILDLRLARGELTITEYNELRDALAHSEHRAPSKPEAPAAGAPS
jgi:putative membrane protein